MFKRQPENAANGTAKNQNHLRLVSITLLFMCFAAIGCQNSQKTPELRTQPVLSPNAGAGLTVAPTLPPFHVQRPKQGSEIRSPVTANALTSSGENADGRLSPDGAHLIFVSRARPSHKQGQVYSLELATMTERRLTFNDGDASSPAWVLGHRPEARQFVYASTTDEIKEAPIAIDQLMRRYLPPQSRPESRPETASGSFDVSELYLQSVDGRSVDRLTFQSGFDGEADPDPKGRRLIFVSTRSGSPSLYVTNIANLRSTRLSLPRLTNSKAIDRSPRFSPDGRWIAWSRQGVGSTGSQIFVNEGPDLKKAKALTPPGATDLHPSWNPTGDTLIFSSNRGGKFFNLFTIDRGGSCLKKLTEVESDLVQPSFSIDGKTIFFTSNNGGTNQIYTMDHLPPEQCLPAQTES